MTDAELIKRVIDARLRKQKHMRNELLALFVLLVGFLLFMNFILPPVSRLVEILLWLQVLIVVLNIYLGISYTVRRQVVKDYPYPYIKKTQPVTLEESEHLQEEVEHG